MLNSINLLLLAIILFLILLIWVFYRIGLKQGQTQKLIELQEQMPQLQRAIADRQRSTIKGKLAETFAPFLPGFPFKPSECKFIGDPIDYLVFQGLDERDIKGIHLVEVKNKNSKLSKHQKQIKELMDSLNSNEFTFREFRSDSN